MSQNIAFYNQIQRERTGFERGLIPYKIVGVDNLIDPWIYLMKWQNCNELELVHALEAKQKCPLIVIQYYRERIAWVQNANHIIYNHCPECNK